MRKLALLLLITLPACTTISNWTNSTMAWADRNFPTYDDIFGDEKPQQPSHSQNQVTQGKAFPSAQVESQPMSRKQEVYYDNTQRGYSF